MGLQAFDFGDVVVGPGIAAFFAASPSAAQRPCQAALPPRAPVLPGTRALALADASETGCRQLETRKPVPPGQCVPVPVVVTLEDSGSDSASSTGAGDIHDAPPLPPSHKRYARPPPVVGDRSLAWMSSVRVVRVIVFVCLFVALRHDPAIKQPALPPTQGSAAPTTRRSHCQWPQPGRPSAA